ncbi:hypothetical protein SEUCBS139899_002157 [Sporothrix eucalyptigena]
MLPFSRKQFLPENDIGDLSGQVTLVTGGNSGFGKKTIFRLAKHNPLKIYMGARTVLKAREAIASIQDKLASEQSESAQSARPRTQIEFLEMDLASLASVKRAAECVVSTTDRLDLLILNTGIMATPASKTVDGFEVQMGTNHVGHFLLSKLLLDLLQHTATAASHDVRVVTVSSSGYMFAPSFDTMIDTDKLDNEGPWSRYGANGRALVRRHRRRVAGAKHWLAVGVLVQAPITALAMLLVAWNLHVRAGPEDATESLGAKLRRVDFWGAGLLSSTVLTFRLVLDMGGAKIPWTSPLLAGLALLSHASAAGFVWLERRWAMEPIFPLHLLARRDVVTTYLVLFFQNASQTAVSTSNIL